MLKNMSIKTKLIALTGVFIFALLIVSGKSISIDMEKHSSLSTLETGIQISIKVSKLIHETQKERGIVSKYINNQTSNVHQELITQRKITDVELLAYTKYVNSIDISAISEETNRSIQRALNTLNNIENIRVQIDAHSIAPATAINYYTNLNSLLVTSIIEVSKVSQSPQVTKELVAYSNFLLAKEKRGVERAIGVGALSHGNFAPGMQIKFNNLLSAQQSYLENFRQFSTDTSYKFYKQTLQGHFVDEVDRIRNFLIYSNKKKLLVSQMKENVGYGGLIHNFKNYRQFEK